MSFNMSNDLKSFIKNIKDKKVLFIGVGNVLKSDDGVGCYIVEELNKKILKTNFYFINAGVVVENYLGKIVDINPDVIVFVDALKVNFQSEQKNKFFIFEQEQLLNYTFSTHNISLSTIIEFLNTELKEKFNKDVKIYILGVKPNSLDFGESLTEETKKFADEIIENIYSYL
jgi:hydrogenase 3 maturation protease